MKLNDETTKSVAGAVSDVLEGKKPVQEMDPKKHVKKNPDSGMFCVYNTAGKKVKEFKSKEEAEKYATDNHDDLMKEVAEPVAKGEKEFKDKHKVKKSGENDDGSVTKEGKLPPALQKAIDAKKKKDGKDEEEVDEVLGFDKDNPKKVSDDEDDDKKEKPSKSEESDKQKKYKMFFDKALKKFGVKSPAELKGDKKREFFDYVDKNYEADNEAD